MYGVGCRSDKRQHRLRDSLQYSVLAVEVTGSNTVACQFADVVSSSERSDIKYLKSQVSKWYKWYQNNKCVSEY